MEGSSPNRFDSLFAAAPLGIVVIAEDGIIAQTNPALEQMFGYERGALIGQSLEELLPEGLRAQHRQHRHGFLRAPHARPMGQGMNLLGRRRDGHTFPIEVSLTHFEHDGATSAVAFVADVSARKRLEDERDRLLLVERQSRAAAEAAERRQAVLAEERQRAAQEHEATHALLHTLMNSAPIGMGFIDTELRFQRMNEYLAAINGLPTEEHIGRTIGEVLPDMAARLEPVIRSVLETGEPHMDLEVRGGTAAGGAEHQYLVSYYPVRTGDGMIVGVGGVVQDITLRRRDEEALRLSEQRFRAIFDDAPLGIVLATPDGRILETNPSFQQMIGYSADELRTMGPQHFVHPDDLSGGLQIREAIVTGRQGRTTVVRRYVRKDGATLRVSLTASFIQNADGAQFLLILLEDVTERLQAEEARARLAAIIDSTEDAILGATLDDTIIAWNAGAERLYGYSAAEAIGQPRTIIIPEERRADLRQINAVIARGESVTHVESVHVHKSGRLLDVTLTFSPIIDAAGTIVGISAIARDVSEQKRVEQLLRRQAAHARLLQVVAVASNQAASAHGALQTAVDAICATTGWVAGRVYLPQDGGGPLVATDIRMREPDWAPAAPDAHAADAGELVLRVQMSGEPEWSAAGADSALVLAFPVLVGAEVAAVLEFVSGGREPPEAALLEVMASVCAQLGRVIERERAERALRESEQLYRTLASNIPNGSVLLFDHQLRFTVADGSALTRVGLSREAVEGRTLAEVLPPAAVARLEPFYRDALAGVRSETESSAGERVYLTYFLPVTNDRGETVAGMAMSHDITELKQSERALREERALLARRVAERTADLSLANAELARAARLKDEFLANMSHELRTPLNSILGRVEALEEGVYGTVDPEHVRVLHGIEESGRHLLSLINDILDLSKIESGRLELELEPLDVALICHASTRMVAQLAVLKRVGVTSTIDSQIETIQADERRLKQVLVNLLSNAVKFTPPGGKVSLEVYVDHQQRTATFSVSDTGIGIAQEDMAKLFQPFVQIDSSLSRQYNGTGLGLALVLRIVKAHGGSIEVESTVGQGSRFSVTLPWVQDAPSRAVRADQSAPDVAGLVLRRALVVEDSATAAGQLTRYLQELGARVEICGYGYDVVEQAAAQQPDVIILDILLPDQSGWDVLRALKAEPRTQAITVVVVSVVDDPARAEELGAAAFLLKPITRAALVEVLQRVVQVPLGQQPAAAPAAGLGTVARVLLAEDNQANIDVLSDYLRGKGYEVAVARNGLEAVMRAEERQVDIILMDIQMPGVDGLEAIRRIRGGPSHAVPIIALTALAMPGDRERCLDAGADGYMMKPVGLRALLAEIEARLAAGTQERSAPRGLSAG